MAQQQSEEQLETGAFSAWLDGMQRALLDGATSDVPCGDCTACCTSSQFIAIGPDETDTLAHIPAELCFPAPGLPGGHVVLGYDERGHCPMFAGGACSIYEHRPRTCRTYDCRIFTATGVSPDADTAPLIARQAQRWRFTADTAEDTARLAEVRAAVAIARDGEIVPRNATHLAVLALRSCSSGGSGG